MFQLWRIVFTCMVFCMIALRLTAQGTEGGIHLQLGLGGASYAGDLTEPDFPMLRTQPMLTAGINITGKGWLQPRLSAGFGSIIEQADGAIIPEHPEVTSTDYVRTTFSQLDAQLQVVFWRKKPLSLSLGAGAGLFFFSPQNLEGDFLIDNPFTRLPEEEYPGAAVSFPLSAGVNLRLRPNMGLRMEYTYRPTNTDYLDNIGLLGTRSGNDRVQSLSVGFWFGLKPPKSVQPPPPSDQETEDGPVVIDIPPAEKPEDGREPTVIPVTTHSEADPEINYRTLEEKALQERRYRYHRVEKKEKLEDIAERYHVRIETLRRVNFMVNDELAEGSLLRVPDLLIK
ncbi:MAG: LysM peptidoglycan-binding domain-containing protein [Bacteroidia bacterium]